MEGAASYNGMSVMPSKLHPSGWRLLYPGNTVAFAHFAHPDFVWKFGGEDRATYPHRKWSRGANSTGIGRDPSSHGLPLGAEPYLATAAKQGRLLLLPAYSCGEPPIPDVGGPVRLMNLSPPCLKCGYLIFPLHRDLHTWNTAHLKPETPEHAPPNGLPGAPLVVAQLRR